MKVFLLVTALLTMTAPGASIGGEGPSGSVRDALEIEAEPIDMGTGTLAGIELRGVPVLRADDPRFGGFSGLEITDGRLLAITDRGWWLEAELHETSRGIVPRAVSFAPLLDGEGASLNTNHGGDDRSDGEGLALTPDGIMATFERDHRIMRRGSDGRMVDAIRDRRFEAMHRNGGLEALAPMPDDALLAIGEAPLEARGHPVFRVGRDGSVSRAFLPEDPPYKVTGADVGPDGRLYVVLRHYSMLLGVSMRLHRYRLSAEGWPLPETREVLAAYDSATGIDNMEGVALWTDAEGRTRLALISDDNFNFVQRTLLMDFVLE